MKVLGISGAPTLDSVIVDAYLKDLASAPTVHQHGPPGQRRQRLPFPNTLAQHSSVARDPIFTLRVLQYRFAQLNQFRGQAVTE